MRGDLFLADHENRGIEIVPRRLESRLILRPHQRRRASSEAWQADSLCQEQSLKPGRQHRLGMHELKPRIQEQALSVIAPGIGEIRAG